MNQVSLIGNLTKDTELRYSTGQNQTAICRFTVAVNDGYGENQRTSYIPIVVFGKIAENCDKFLFKGSKVGIVGRIQTGSYEKDGRKVYTTDVVASNVEFLTKRDSENGFYQNHGDFSNYPQQPQYQPQQAPQYPQQPQYVPNPQPQPVQQTVTAPQYAPPQPQNPPQTDMGGFTALTDDDIPFE